MITLRHCHTCQTGFRPAQLRDPDTCPACGGELKPLRRSFQDTNKTACGPKVAYPSRDIGTSGTEAPLS